MQLANAKAVWLPGRLPWWARTTGWSIITMILACVAGAALIRMPHRVESGFIVVARQAAAGSAAPVEDPAPLLRLQIPQRQLTKVHVGQRLDLHYDAMPSRRWGVQQATLASIGGFVGDDGLVPAFAELDEPVVESSEGSQRVLIGMTGTARITLGEGSLLEQMFSPETHSGTSRKPYARNDS